MENKGTVAIIKDMLMSYLKMIKIENSLFSLPFAIAAMVLAAGGMPKKSIIFWVVFCVVTIRSGATGFNRWYWADYDARNPRTRGREIPSGKLSSVAALTFVIISFALFIAGAYQINKLAFYLSPIPIVLFLCYTFLRQYSPLSHLALGIAAGTAPLGGWIAVTGSFDVQLTALTMAVVAWYIGFDLFYAIRDADFDREQSFASVPAKFGVVASLALARGLHVTAFFLFFLHGAEYSLKLIYFAGLIISAAILMAGHYRVTKYGPDKLDKYFFNMRGTVSVILCVAMILDIAKYGIK